MDCGRPTFGDDDRPVDVTGEDRAGESRDELPSRKEEAEALCALLAYIEPDIVKIAPDALPHLARLASALRQAAAER